MAEILSPDATVITQLNCQERIDCPSPEMFHDVLPGAWNIKKQFAVTFFILENFYFKKFKWKERH